MNYQIFYYVKHNFKIDAHSVSYRIGEFVHQFLGSKPNYQKYNDMTGCLIRCYKEIKRRLNIDIKDMIIELMELYDPEIDYYENFKREENGDVE